MCMGMFNLINVMSFVIIMPFLCAPWCAIVRIFLLV